VQLIVLTADAYFDYLFHVENRNLKRLFPENIDPNRAQIFWLSKGKSIHMLNSDDIANKSIYEKNTLDLIAQK
jgi:hypothetical protein